MKLSHLVAFEVVTGASMVLVILSQAPHVATEHFKAIHYEPEVARRKQVAAAARKEFQESNASARLIFGEIRGFMVWFLGLCFIIFVYPDGYGSFSTSIIFLVMAAQLAITVLFDFWGLRRARYISRAVRRRPQPEE
jgi:hypothetical protein